MPHVLNVAERIQKDAEKEFGRESGRVRVKAEGEALKVAYSLKAFDLEALRAFD